MKPWLRRQVCEVLVDEQGKLTERSVEYKHTALYFCDRTCSPFTLQLKAFCDTLNGQNQLERKKKRKNIELQVIVVSSDEREEDLSFTMEGTGWYALPLKHHLQESMCKDLRVDEVPSLILLDNNWNILDEFAQYSVLLNKISSFPWKVPHFKEIDETVLCELNFRPCIVVFLDSPPHMIDYIDSENVISALKRVSLDPALSSSYYFYAPFGNPLAHQLRAKLRKHLDATDPPPASIAVLDLKNSFTYFQEFPKWDFDSIEYFETAVRDVVIGFTNGLLTQNSKSEIAPPFDLDPEHPGIVQVVHRNLARLLEPRTRPRRADSRSSSATVQCFFLHVYVSRSDASIQFKKELEDLAHVLTGLGMIGNNLRIGLMNGDLNDIDTRFIQESKLPISKLFYMSQSESTQWESLVYTGPNSAEGLLQFIQTTFKDQRTGVDFERALKEWKAHTKQIQ